MKAQKQIKSTAAFVFIMCLFVSCDLRDPINQDQRLGGNISKSNATDEKLSVDAEEDRQPVKSQEAQPESDRGNMVIVHADLPDLNQLPYLNEILNDAGLHIRFERYGGNNPPMKILYS